MNGAEPVVPAREPKRAPARSQYADVEAKAPVGDLMSAIADMIARFKREGALAPPGEIVRPGVSRYPVSA